MARSALAALRSLAKAERVETSTQEVPAPPAPSPRLVGLDGFGRVAGMTLEEFEKAGLVVRVSSALLGEDVLFVSENATRTADEADLVAYTPSELRLLAPMPAGCVQTLHLVKKTFPGSVLSDLTPDTEKGDG